MLALYKNLSVYGAIRGIIGIDVRRLATAGVHLVFGGTWCFRKKVVL